MDEERRALNTILANFLFSDEGERKRTEARVRATVARAKTMGILDVGSGASEWRDEVELFGSSTRSELMDYYLSLDPEAGQSLE